VKKENPPSLTGSTEKDRFADPSWCDEVGRFSAVSFLWGFDRRTKEAREEGHLINPCELGVLELERQTGLMGPPQGQELETACLLQRREGIGIAIYKIIDQAGLPVQKTEGQGDVTILDCLAENRHRLIDHGTLITILCFQELDDLFWKIIAPFKGASGHQKKQDTPNESGAGTARAGSGHHPRTR
jgi:hypothetical protein